MNNRTLKERDEANPDVALIRKTSSTNIERGWKYLELLIRKSQKNSPELKEWLNVKYHLLEEKQFLEVQDLRGIAGALFYVGLIYTQGNPNKHLIRNILRPVSQPTLDKRIRDVQDWLNV